jgi:hypothetical protein
MAGQVLEGLILRENPQNEARSPALAFFYSLLPGAGSGLAGKAGASLLAIQGVRVASKLAPTKIVSSFLPCPGARSGDLYFSAEPERTDAAKV